jgi:hypothetical protein
MILSTVNVVVGQFSTFLGLLNVVLAIVYAAFYFSLIVSQRRSVNATTFYILQFVFVPVSLLIAGVIIFFNGWRLDPLLQFAFFLLNALVIFLGAKEFSLYRNRQI